MIQGRILLFKWYLRKQKTANDLARMWSADCLQSAAAVFRMRCELGQLARRG